jgi:hypothetical protein
LAARALENSRVTGASTKAKVSKVILRRADFTAANIGGKKTSPFGKVRTRFPGIHEVRKTFANSFVKLSESTGVARPTEEST